MHLAKLFSPLLALFLSSCLAHDDASVKNTSQIHANHAILFDKALTENDFEKIEISLSHNPYLSEKERMALLDWLRLHDVTSPLCGDCIADLKSVQKNKTHGYDLLALFLKKSRSVYFEKDKKLFVDMQDKEKVPGMALPPLVAANKESAEEISRYLLAVNVGDCRFPNTKPLLPPAAEYYVSELRLLCDRSRSERNYRDDFDFACDDEGCERLKNYTSERRKLEYMLFAHKADVVKASDYPHFYLSSGDNRNNREDLRVKINAKRFESGTDTDLTKLSETEQRELSCFPSFRARSLFEQAPCAATVYDSKALCEYFSQYLPTLSCEKSQIADSDDTKIFVAKYAESPDYREMLRNRLKEQLACENLLECLSKQNQDDIFQNQLMVAENAENNSYEMRDERAYRQWKSLIFSDRNLEIRNKRQVFCNFCLQRAKNNYSCHRIVWPEDDKVEKKFEIFTYGNELAYADKDPVCGVENIAFAQASDYTSTLGPDDRLSRIAAALLNIDSDAAGLEITALAKEMLAHDFDEGSVDRKVLSCNAKAAMSIALLRDRAVHAHALQMILKKSLNLTFGKILADLPDCEKLLKNSQKEIYAEVQKLDEYSAWFEHRDFSKKKNIKAFSSAFAKKKMPMAAQYFLLAAGKKSNAVPITLRKINNRVQSHRLAVSWLYRDSDPEMLTTFPTLSHIFSYLAGRDTQSAYIFAYLLSEKSDFGVIKKALPGVLSGVPIYQNAFWAAWLSYAYNALIPESSEKAKLLLWQWQNIRTILSDENYRKLATDTLKALYYGEKKEYCLTLTESLLSDMRRKHGTFEDTTLQKLKILHFLFERGEEGDKPHVVAKFRDLLSENPSLDQSYGDIMEYGEDRRESLNIITDAIMAEL